MCYKCHWYIKIFSLSNQKYREMTEEEMTNSKRLKRTFSRAIKSSSGDCETSETHKRPFLWLQFLSPAQNDLVHWITGVRGKLRPVGKCSTWWATGQTVYCMVVWLQWLGLCSKCAFGHLLELMHMVWTRAGFHSHPLGCRASIQERIPRIHILSLYS